MKTTNVTVRLSDVLVSLELPHESVDTETIIESALESIQNNSRIKVIPRWNGVDRDDGPEFVAFIETVGDIDIEEDGRSEKPEEFDASLEWWQELHGKDSR